MRIILASNSERRKHLHNEMGLDFIQVSFDSECSDAVEDQLVKALIRMNDDSEYVKSFAGFQWIIDSLLYL